MVRKAAVTPNHYATLGLTPTSEDVVIRAAYLALMRRYHPDRNPSAEAAAHARAIAAAYAVIGDPVQRAEYDQMRAEEAWPRESAPRPAVLPGGAFAAASIALLVAIVALVVWSPIPTTRLQADTPARAADRVAAAAEPVSTETPAELFAAETSIPPAEPEPAAERPMVEPEPPAPAQPPRLLAAAAPPPPTTEPRPPSVNRTPRPAAPQPAVAKASAPAARPSFSCQVARTRGEIAVCRNGDLANLDRQQALLYAQSWGRADAAKRAQLLSTRDRFVAERDSCRSDSCTSGAYLDRMREVSEIMTGEAVPTR